MTEKSYAPVTCEKESWKHKTVKIIIQFFATHKDYWNNRKVNQTHFFAFLMHFQDDIEHAA